MSCDRLRRALVEDDPEPLRELKEHAAACAACAEVAEGHRRLLEAAAVWKGESPPPSPSLEPRIAAAVAREARAGGERIRPWRPRLFLAPRRRWRALAAAAAAVVIAAVLYPLLPLPGGKPAEESPLAALLDEIDEAERSYVSALARLDREAARVLERVDDPALPAAEAALLLAYGDRLTHLDAVIAEVRGYLERNPGHSGGHKVLIAAYREKSEVLQEVLGLQLGGSS